MRFGKGSISLTEFYYSGEGKHGNGSVETKRRFQNHLDRVKTIKPVVDNSCPGTLKPRTENKKPTKFQRERDAKIDRDNQALLTKVTYILEHPPKFEPPFMFPNNPFEEARHKKLVDIEKQNQKLVKRIFEITRKSPYDHKELLEECDRNQYHARRLMHYNMPESLKKAHEIQSNKSIASNPIKSKQVLVAEVAEIKKSQSTVPPPQPEPEHAESEPVSTEAVQG